MRFTIKYKLFLTLLVATLAVVATMVFLIKLSFERGFLEYVNRVEQEVHNNLVTNLGDAYRENENWDFIRDNPRQFREIHRSSTPVPGTSELRSEADRDPGPGDFRRRRDFDSPKRGNNLPPFMKHRRDRVCLLDENREPVTYCRNQGEEMQVKKIDVDGKTVGYLAINPKRRLSEDHDLQFSAQQHRFLLLLGFCVALISILLAYPVSRQLVRPIKVLAEATRNLAAGQYQTRIRVDTSDELGDLSRDFNSLAATLENNEQARQQWIADISHELRTPLSVLRGEIEALQDGLREVNTARLDSLHLQVMNLNRLVNDLYELSMSDIGALNYQKAVIDGVDLLQQSVESLRDEFEQKQIEVSVGVPRKTVRIFADAERLQQLFSNLLINSLRYTNSGGRLNITLEEQDSTLSISMEDSAPGVADEHLPRLFERLYRVDISRNRESGGTGLGLAICKNIVDAHGGSIKAETSSLGGLKIIIQLPKD